VLLQTAAKKSLFVAGRALADGAIMDKRLLKRSEFYHDFWRADGILHACAGLVFDQHSAPIPPTVLGLYRGPERPPFGRKDERLVELLIPHLQRALRIALQINGARMLSAVCDRMFEASHSAMAVCSRDGRLLYANARMERILGEQDGLTYREGRVAVLRERDHEAFLRALAACAEPPVVAAPLEDALQIHRRSGKAAYAVRVHQLPGWDRLFGLGIQAVACLQITDPAETPRDLTETLRRLYGLTAAESRLVAALARGDTPKAAAERFQVTENTIRTQLKSALGQDRRAPAGRSRLARQPLGRGSVAQGT
jgi:PAS domain-containing protein